LGGGREDGVIVCCVVYVAFLAATFGENNSFHG
jgi:hypothetical protein